MMAIQKSTVNNIRCVLASTLTGLILGLAIGGGVVYKYLTLDHFMVHKTNIGFMIFIKDKIYNLSEMRSLEQ